MATSGRVWSRVARLERNRARVAVAEARRSRSGPCSECGASSDPSQTLWRVISDDDHAEIPCTCPSCGRQRVFEVRFDSDG